MAAELMGLFRTFPRRLFELLARSAKLGPGIFTKPIDETYLEILDEAAPGFIKRS